MAQKSIIPMLLILPLGIWGNTVFQGQTNTLILCISIFVSLAMPNDYLKLFGLLACGWLAAAYSFSFVGSSPLFYIIDGTMMLLFSALIFLSVYHLCIDREKIYFAICVTAVIQAVIGVLQYHGLDPVSPLLSLVVTVQDPYGINVPAGTLGNPNFLAAYVAIALPFFFRRRWWWFLPLLVYVLIITKTSTAFAAACIGTAFYFFGWKGVVAGVVPAAIYLLIDHPNILHNERFDYWLDGLRMLSQSWWSIIFGTGPGIPWRIGNMLHSEYINTAWNFGAIGLALMISYIVDVFETYVDKRLFAAFIIVCVDSLGNHPLHTIPTAVLAVVIMALLEKERPHAIGKRID